MYNDTFSISSNEIFNKLMVDSKVIDAQAMSKIFNYVKDLYLASKKLNTSNPDTIVQCKTCMLTDIPISLTEPFDVKTKIGSSMNDSYLFEFEMILRKDNKNIGKGDFIIQSIGELTK